MSKTKLALIILKSLWLYPNDWRQVIDDYVSPRAATRLAYYQNKNLAANKTTSDIELFLEKDILLKKGNTKITLSRFFSFFIAWVACKNIQRKKRNRKQIEEEKAVAQIFEIVYNNTDKKSRFVNKL